MTAVLPLTISEIMKRKYFENTSIVAGCKGINRVVKWVHVVEVTNIGKLLNGSELILTTGISWSRDVEQCLSFLKQLIDSKAAGLCIELGTYTSTIHEEMIAYANQNDFPIILFEQEVAFVDITQDIHTYLIHQQYQLISDLEYFSQILNKKLLSINHYDDILQLLQQKINKQLIFHIRNNQDMIFFPKPSIEEQEKLKQLIQNDTLLSYQFTKVPIYVLENQYAEIMIVTEDRPLSEFDYLLLDRTANAVSQYLLNNLYVEEKKFIKQTEWITDWINGFHEDEAILHYLSDMKIDQIDGATVCICRHESTQQKSNIDFHYFKLYFRSIFEQQGFSSLVTENRNEFIFILLNKRSIDDWKQRLRTAIDRILTSDYVVRQPTKLSFGIGKMVQPLTQIGKSFQTAEETLRIQRKVQDSTAYYFYEDLHLYRLISLLNHHMDLREFVLEYLQPVFEHDLHYNGKLFETLRVYLQCNGSKQETAKRLFVVRQTLYHRLEKLQKLLGTDFMTPEKRVAIEFMILTYDYLLPAKETFFMKMENH